MFKIDKKVLDAIIEEEAEERFKNRLDEWRSMDNKPAVVTEPDALDKEPVAIDPKSNLQVVDEDMPIEDRKWIPGNPDELARAMRQMAGLVPEGQIEWFYLKLRHLIDKSIDNEDEARMKPRLEN